jgi:hypothetical protein
MVQEASETRNVVSFELPDTENTPDGLGPPPATPVANGISDDQFITELNRLRSLRSFLNNEAVTLAMSEADTRALGDLFTLTLNSRGRQPTGTEWSELDRFNQLFFQRLTEAQRRRFLLGGIPEVFARIPIIFVAIALISILLSVALPTLPLLFASVWKGQPPAWINTLSFSLQQAGFLSCYLFWLISLGALGSIAFIGMNALSVQQDITFDLLNRRLINLRVALGALFALVLALPWGFEGYREFILQITAGPQIQIAAGNQSNSLSASNALMLIVPFLLGFSTSLVIMILNRLLEAAQSFFGKTVTMTVPPTTESTHSDAASGTLNARRAPRKGKTHSRRK